MNEVNKNQSIRKTSMIGSDDTGRNYCYCCGHSWQTKRRWLYWPIQLCRQPNLGQRKYEQRRWAIWSWQVGADRMSQPVFGWTVRIWRLLIKFGDMKAKMRCRYDSEYGVWVDNRLKERKTNEG